jgi:hypothetical protein
VAKYIDELELAGLVMVKNRGWTRSNRYTFGGVSVVNSPSHQEPGCDVKPSSLSDVNSTQQQDVNSTQQEEYSMNNNFFKNNEGNQERVHSSIEEPFLAIGGLGRNEINNAALRNDATPKGDNSKDQTGRLAGFKPVISQESWKKVAETIANLRAGNDSQGDVSIPPGQARAFVVALESYKQTRNDRVNSSSEQVDEADSLLEKRKQMNLKREENSGWNTN